MKRIKRKESVNEHDEDLLELREKFNQLEKEVNKVKSKNKNLMERRKSLNRELKEVKMERTKDLDCFVLLFFSSIKKGNSDTKRRIKKFMEKDKSKYIISNFEHKIDFLKENILKDKQYRKKFFDFLLKEDIEDTFESGEKNKKDTKKEVIDNHPVLS